MSEQGADQARVRVTVPNVPGSPFSAETVLAVPYPSIEDCFILEEPLMFTSGVNALDVVRCERVDSDYLVAVEVVVRSPLVAGVFAPSPDVLSGDAPATDMHRDVDAFEEALNDSDIPAWSSRIGGALAVCAPHEHFPSVLDMAASGSEVEYGEDSGTAGSMVWTITSHPSMEVPSEIAGASDLVDELRSSGFDWGADDEVAKRWPQSLKVALREQAEQDIHLRRALREKRYLAALAPGVRNSVMDSFGPDRTGPQRFPLDGDGPFFDSLWSEAKTEDGKVRWCTDPDANERFRGALLRLGVDPDSDPRKPLA